MNIYLKGNLPVKFIDKKITTFNFVRLCLESHFFLNSKTKSTINHFFQFTVFADFWTNTFVHTEKEEKFNALRVSIVK